MLYYGHRTEPETVYYDLVSHAPSLIYTPLTGGNSYPPLYLGITTGEKMVAVVVRRVLLPDSTNQDSVAL